MKPSARCLSLVKSYEGYHRALPNGDCGAYPDPGSDDGEPVTIGWGTTRYAAQGLQKYGRSKVIMSDTLTSAQAESELLVEINAISNRLNAMGLNLNQNQFDAVTSFCFNCGFPKPQMDRLVKGQLKEFHDKMDEYVKGGNGKPLQGLIRRRNEEQALFMEPVKGAPVMADKYYLINKDGLWLMEDEKALSKIRSHSLEQIITANLMPYNIVVEWERKVDEPEEAKPEAPKPDYSVAKLTRYLDAVKMPQVWRNAGLKPLKLEIGDQEFLVVSGQGYAQNFRKPEDRNSYPGNMEPIPQGNYTIENISWAGGKDNYNASHGPGLGPVWVGLPAQFKDDRGSFGIHFDPEGNGTAGCVGLHSIEQVKAFVAALRKFDPKTLVVDWKL